MKRYEWDVLPVLRGKDVLLRPITWEDTEKIVHWRNNPKVRENFIFQGAFTNALHTNWIREKVIPGHVIQYIIVRNDTRTPIGSIYYRDLDYSNETAELGIFIGEDAARGCGFGTQALRLFLDFGLHQLGLHRIQLRVLDQNEQARRSYLRAGFQEEGLFRDMIKREGRYISVAFMAFIAGEDTMEER